MDGIILFPLFCRLPSHTKTHTFTHTHTRTLGCAPHLTAFRWHHFIKSCSDHGVFCSLRAKIAKVASSMLRRNFMLCNQCMLIRISNAIVLCLCFSLSNISAYLLLGFLVSLEFLLKMKTNENNKPILHASYMCNAYTAIIFVSHFNDSNFSWAKAKIRHHQHLLRKCSKDAWVLGFWRWKVSKNVHFRQPHKNNAKSQQIWKSSSLQ